MGSFIKTQNSFANGEVAPEFFAKDSINGLSKLENMDVLSSGSLTNRKALKYIAEIASSAKLISFSVAENENYLLVLTDGYISIYYNDKKIQDLLSPWNESDLTKLQYAQRFNSIIFVHPDYQPRSLKKSGTKFALEIFDFARNDETMEVYIPFVRFTDSENVKITVSSNEAGNNYATFTTNTNFWTENHVGVRLFLAEKQWRIEEYISPTQVKAFTNGTYTTPKAPVSDWQEAAFSDFRGWPCSITFHQDRLVFGGSRSYPSGVWLSQVGRHNNFNVGTGLDDEAIYITLLSQQRQQICTVVSSDNLQILTSVGEWAISSKPLTPSSVDIKQHTSVGSVSNKYLAPQKIEGQTVFISKSEKDIRELSLDELGENYNANDLSALSKHLINNPIDIAYNEATRQLFVVMANGNMAVLNQNSALGVSAWANYTTKGSFISVAVVDSETYVVVKRENKFNIEKFSDVATLDADKYAYTYCAKALPLRASGHNAKMLRIRKIDVRVLNTKSISINQSRVALPNEVYEENSTGYTGDVSVNVMGMQRNCIQSPWEISGEDNQPITVLSVTCQGYYIV